MKPTPGRIVLYYPGNGLPPWPAVVVEVVDDRDPIFVDLQGFSPRGQGEGDCNRLERIRFTSPEGLPKRDEFFHEPCCYWPPRE